MKSIVHTCLLFFAGLGAVSAQSAQKPTQINYDFYRKKFTTDLPTTIRRNAWVQVRVDNINPYVYKIIVAQRDSTTPVGTAPSLLTGFFDTDKMVKVAAMIGGTANPGAVVAGAATATQRRAVEGCIAQQRAMSNVIIQYVKDVNKLKAQVLHKLNDYSNPLLLKQLQKIDVKASPANQFVSKAYVVNPSRVDADFGTYFLTAEQLQTTFATNYATYRLLVTDCLSAFPSNKQLQVTDSLIKQFELEQRPVLADFAPKLYEKLYALKSNLMNLRAEDFSFTSAPMKMDQPMKTIKITFEPVGTANVGLSTDVLAIPLQYKKQPFIGFSSGFFYSTLRGNPYVVRDSVALVARNGQTRSDSLSHYYRLTPEDRGSGEWGVAALIHYGESINAKQNVHLHVAAGVGLTLQNKPQPRGLLGGGVAFGLRNKVALTVGLIFGAVETLSDGYQVDVNRTLYAAPNGFSKSQLKGGGFFSLTYNFLTI